MQLNDYVPAKCGPPPWPSGCNGCGLCSRLHDTLHATHQFQGLPIPAWLMLARMVQSLLVLAMGLTCLPPLHLMAPLPLAVEPALFLKVCHWTGNIRRLAMPAPHATHVRFGARGDRLVANYHSDHAYVFDTTRSASPGAVAGAFPTGFIRSCRATPLPPVIRPPGKRKAELEPCRCVAQKSSGHVALFGHGSEELKGNEG